MGSRSDTDITEVTIKDNIAYYVYYTGCPSPTKKKKSGTLDFHYPDIRKYINFFISSLSSEKNDTKIIEIG